MDARTDIETRLPSRRATEGFGRAVNAAPHLPTIRTDAAEIFKKTPCAAGLKPGGRFVAKDMIQVGAILKGVNWNPYQDADVGTSNVKLTDADLVGHTTKSTFRQTNHTAGDMWKRAQRVGPAADGAVNHPGGAHEKQCYADI